MEILKETAKHKALVRYLIDVAKRSTCKQSKCGSIIITPGLAGRTIIIGEGYNSMPCNIVGECFKDILSATFKSDRTCCVHAEQRAIIDALKREFSVLIPRSSLFFIRLDENDNPIHAGKPYCSICSKMALDIGISNFVLWHKEGWTSYTTQEYNDLTFQYK